MDGIGVINPQSGEIHYVPYQDLGAAMEAGGQFADEEQKQKAIQFQQSESKIPSTPFNQNEEEEEPEQPPEETTGWKGLGKDAIEMLRGSLKGLGGFAKRVPDEAKELIKDRFKNPLDMHNEGQLAASLVGGARDTLNIPYKAIKELGEKDIIPDWLKKYNELPFTHIPEDTGVESALGLEPTRKSDELVRAVPAIAGGVTAIVKGGAKALTALKAPSKEVLFQRALQQTIDKAKEAHNLSKADITNLQNNLTEEFSSEFGKRLGNTSPTGQKESINVKQAKIGELAPDIAIPEKPVPEVPEVPDVKSAEKSLADALESTKSHDVHGGRILQKAITEDKKATENLYNQYRQHLSKSDIKVNNNAQIKEVTQALDEMKAADELAPGYGIGTDEQKALESQLTKLQSETVNAEHVFAVKRTLDKMADDTRAKQYSGVSDLEFKQLKSVADRLEAKANKLGKVLENVGGEDATKMLKQANKGWSDYAAARNHPVGRKVLKEGILPPNTIGKLNSTERGTDYLNRIKDSDMRLQKHILSQKYGKESQFKNLLNPKEEVEPYLANLEELHPHIENLRETKYAATEHKKLADSMQKVAEEQIKRQKAIKESDELKKQIKFHEDAIPKLEAKIKAAEQKGAEHARLDKELKEHRQHLKDKNYRLKKYGNAMLRLTGVSSLLHKAGL